MASSLCPYERSVLAVLVFAQVRVTGAAGSQAFEVLRKRGLADDDGATAAGRLALVVTPAE